MINCWGLGAVDPWAYIFYIEMYSGGIQRNALVDIPRLVADSCIPRFKEQESHWRTEVAM